MAGVCIHILYNTTALAERMGMILLLGSWDFSHFWRNETGSGGFDRWAVTFRLSIAVHSQANPSTDSQIPGSPGERGLMSYSLPVGVRKIASLFCSRIIYCFCDRSTCYYCTLKYESFEKGAVGEKGCGGLPGCNYLKSSANVYYHAIKCKWDEAKRTDLSIARLGKMDEKGQFVWAHIPDI